MRKSRLHGWVQI